MSRWSTACGPGACARGTCAGRRPSGSGRRGGRADGCSRRSRSRRELAGSHPRSRRPTFARDAGAERVGRNGELERSPGRSLRDLGCEAFQVEPEVGDETRLIANDPLLHDPAALHQAMRQRALLEVAARQGPVFGPSRIRSGAVQRGVPRRSRSRAAPRPHPRRNRLRRGTNGCSARCPRRPAARRGMCRTRRGGRHPRRNSGSRSGQPRGRPRSHLCSEGCTPPRSANGSWAVGERGRTACPAGSSVWVVSRDSAVDVVLHERA